MLNHCNPLVEAFRCYRDRIQDIDTDDDMRLVLVNDRTKDKRTHNLPTCSEVAALIPGGFEYGVDKRDIVLETVSGGLKRISELYPGYLALQYPLLFPYGEDGFSLGIKVAAPFDEDDSGKTISQRMFYAYRLHDRVNESQLIIRSKRLFQQLVVDKYTMLEAGRLRYIRKNQKKLRCDKLSNIIDSANDGDGDLSGQGQRVLLPASFVGGPRYMMQNYLDAMAICKYIGFPDLFITFTCNPKWPEITRYVEPRKLRPEDRPDILCRIFKMKLDRLMLDLTENHHFGKTRAGMYTIEFQKRGLPHAHILLFMDASCKFPTTDDIDKVICAEIPDKEKDPELYDVVKDMMIHGPCGRANMNSPCMVNGMCSKFFPKEFNETTIIDDDGYPIYRRRNDKRYIQKSGNFKCSNAFVVPYNRELLIRYRAHINVEWCNQSRSIKYLFKYINKGQDQVVAKITKGNKGNVVVDSGGNNTGNATQTKKDDIKDWFNCRYVSACEAAWRLFANPIHFRTIPVQKLMFHLPGQAFVIYNEDESRDEFIQRKANDRTMFEAFFEACKKYPKARELTYPEFPNWFAYKSKGREWTPRKQGFTIGRINNVSIKHKEAYYMRILLNKIKGPRDFDELKTIDGEVFETYKEACLKLGLLDDDKEYIAAIAEASFWASGFFLRKLFAIMLLTESLSTPLDVWNESWVILSEDILNRRRRYERNRSLTLTEAQLKNFALIDIENILRSNGSSLSAFDMPLPDDIDDETNINRMLFDERNYDRDALSAEHDDWFLKLTEEQKGVYTQIVDAVWNDQGGVFFVYGFGGTGKTFLWKILSAAVRSKGQIVLNVASSGIASLLLPGGRTAHSRFGIPINPDEFTMCTIKPGTHAADVISEAKLIIWDEAPMMSRHCFETLDRSMRDIVKNARDLPFGGKVVVFGGDFRQVLPVIPGAGRNEIVNASLNSSYLWDECKVLKLTKNMRLFADMDPVLAMETKDFSEWILDIGDGKINQPNDGEVLIDIPDEFLVKDCENPIESIVNEIYGHNFGHQEYSFFKQRAILCPTNDDVDAINNYMLDRLTGEEREYLSSDSIDPADISSINNDALSSDFLNGIDMSGLPKHSLRLRVGAPVMLLRNIDPKEGLCNGTRMVITQVADHVIEAIVISFDTDEVKRAYIPRMIVSPPEGKYPFRMRRRQFPIAVAFAMTINKSQGQTLQNVGLYLPRPVFSHGQLYVAVSRVTKKSGLKILITDSKGKPQKQTMNVVFKEIFDKL